MGLAAGVHAHSPGSFLKCRVQSIDDCIGHLTIPLHASGAGGERRDGGDPHCHFVSKQQNANLSRFQGAFAHAAIKLSLGYLFLWLVISCAENIILIMSAQSAVLHVQPHLH